MSNVDKINFYLERSSLKSKMGDVEGALKELDELLEFSPENPIAHNNKGIIKMDILNDFEGAVSEFEKAVEKEPKQAEFWFNLGLAKMNCNKLDDALDCYSKVFSCHEQVVVQDNRIFSMRFAANYNIGKILFNLGEFGESEFYLSNAIKNNPKMHEPYTARGLVNLAMRKYNKALGDFKKAHKLNPSKANENNIKNLELKLRYISIIKNAFSENELIDNGFLIDKISDMAVFVENGTGIKKFGVVFKYEDAEKTYSIEFDNYIINIRLLD
ncbi:MAG: tetratricopeptide repeat protein [Candidatus Nanoarchaeia archaeon]|nr:tetratricopeptide repeat protein [Candidatus Nanoarchaeia archaeon]